MPRTIETFRGDYFFLSNFFDVDLITADGLYWRNAECLYQALKCARYKDREQFCTLSGKDAKALGQEIRCVKNWDTLRVQQMRSVLALKFNSVCNAKVSRMLFDTGHARLIHGNTHGDTFWGVTADGIGANILGLLLMERRTLLH